jgi:endonuclease/exonuclease/phosphatase family metal-dependent hydrolase
VRSYAAQEPGHRTVRAALLATVTPESGPALRLVCTHLTSNDAARLGDRRNPLGERMFRGGPRHDPREPLRRAQLRELSGWLAAEASRPVLLGGDLNTGPQYPLWWEWLTDLALRHPALRETLSRTPGLPATYDNAYAALGKSEGQLDHLIGFGGTEVLRTEVVLQERVPMPAPRGLGPMVERLIRFRDLRPWTGTFFGPCSDHHGLLAEVACARGQ